ncbi:MAG: hypothetical protein LUD01_06625, partial [Clostridiales bacterium]|nr:hypothetical protein [Clostridiales bacterium]
RADSGLSPVRNVRRQAHIQNAGGYIHRHFIFCARSVMFYFVKSLFKSSIFLQQYYSAESAK